MLYGEAITVYELRDGWAWGQCALDDYVGYLSAECLAAGAVAPTHKVAALRAFVFPEPDLKAPPRDALSLGAPVVVVEHAVTGTVGYARLADGGWVAEVTLAPADAVVPDFAATAERFVGAPYLWGGRSSLGLDCSALVQVALTAAGIRAPRDTYLQVEKLGTLVADHGGVPLQRGDLVFFPGHVGIMADDTVLIHANATTMSVARERLAEVEARVKAAEVLGITAVRRLEG